MCIAAPGRVKEINGREALVSYPGTTQKALVGVKDLKVGDRVLVQMGIIIKIIDHKSEKQMTEAWKKK
ncbi:MAG: HypC/HybG/HupF family hydrogenase formation chaperone [Patescibacteria group bacterium]